MKRNVNLIDLKGFLTSSQAGKRCGLLRGSIHYAVESGQLPAVRVANLLLLKADDVDAWNDKRLQRIRTLEKIQQLKQELKEKRK